MKAMLIVKNVEVAAIVCAVVLVACAGRATVIAEETPAKGPPKVTAGPIIVSWTNSKTKSRKRMFLVRQGEKIAFSVQGPTSCRWLVNKKVREKAKGRSFTWTVPPSRGIWEVRADAGRSHIEWVVSTLAKKEAPIVFDYFCDLKLTNRAEHDPWGRPLPKWKSNNLNVASGYAKVAWRPGRYNYIGNLSLPSSVAYGTWRMRWRKTAKRGTDNNGFTFSVGYKSGAQWRANIFSDLHKRFRGTSSEGHKMELSKLEYNFGPFPWNSPDADWHTVTFIRTPPPENFLYQFFDGVYYPESFEPADWLGDEAAKVGIQFIAEKTLEIYCDGIEVYDRQYLFPTARAVYGIYSRSYEGVFGGTGKPGPWDQRQGIIVHGRGVTPEKIARLVDDPKLFEYDPARKTAVAHTNLCIEGAAELLLKDVTLLMASRPGKPLDIRVKNGATVRLEKARLATTGKTHFTWTFTGAANLGQYRDTKSTSHNFDGVFVARNSQIDNCAHLFLDGPTVVEIKNTKISNLHAIDAGDYSFSPYGWGRDYESRRQKNLVKGEKGLWFFTKLPPARFVVDGLEITSKKPGIVKFIGFDPTGETVVYNSDFGNNEVAAHKAFNISIQHCMPDRDVSSTVNLVNCRFKGVRSLSDRAAVKVKHYLDVRAVDTAGRPVRGAKVTVTNDVGGKFVPAERRWDGRPWSRWGAHKEWMPLMPLLSAVTGADGHTPLPSDAEHSLIVTDYIARRPGSERMEITFTANPFSNFWDWHIGPALIVHDENGANSLVKKLVFCPVWGIKPSWHKYRTGDILQVKVTYKESKIRLLVTEKKSGKTVWETGECEVRGRHDFKRVVFRTPDRHYDAGSEVVARKIAWRKGHIHLESAAGGKGKASLLRAHVQRLRLTAAGEVLEENDYSADPKLVARTTPYEEYFGRVVPPKENFEKHYVLKKGTGGRPFTWEFDLHIDEDMHPPVATHGHGWKTHGYYGENSRITIGLTGDGSGPARAGQRYTITVEKGGRKKVITGINPGPHWYRPDPNVPTYTITAVLDGKTESEANLIKKGRAGPAGRRNAWR
ncbi:MAG: hypothetical protein KAV00_07905 [Phycisphaerae bacterium]|nr:hypothetical protein [Phycisphaerae bacterium]